MNDCLTQNISNNSNESVDKSVVRSAMDSVPQQSPQTCQQTAQQSQTQTTQLLIGQQMSPIVTPIDVSPQNHNSVNDSSVNSSAIVSVNSTLISSNVSEAQNSMSSASNLTVTSSAPSVSTPMSAQGSVQPTNTQSPQLIVSSSQPQLVPTSQTTHLNASGLMHQSLNATITSMANQTMQMTAQTAQHNQMQPLLQTSVQPTGNQMSVTMSQLPQVQVIQQQLGAAGGTYQLQQVYPQGMLLPGNLTIQNMNFQNQGLSLQIPFSGTGGVSTGTMPITSIAAKPPIMSKGVAISPLTHSQHHMISPLKPNMSAQSAQQIIKQVLPQQFMPHSSTNQTVVISQLLPQQNQHSVQQSILPANANKTLLEAQKGKPFGTGSIRSAFGNKMLSHSAAIQPKSPILPNTSISSSLLTNSQFKSPFHTNANTTQLIATQNGSNLITNPQILGSFQTIGPGLTWATSPQSTHLVAPNGSPIFIRGPGQNGEHMFISTSNMSSPHIQTMSMATPVNVHNSVHTPIQVSSASTQSAIAPAPLHNTLQTISVTSNANTATTTTSVASHSIATGPAATASVVNKTKILRQISSVATQTASPASAQKVESTTNLKPIAPAKPKPSAQQLAQNKQNSKELNSTPIRSTSVGTTQTVNPSPPAPAQLRPPSNKSDASNQTHKVSVATETPKVNSQVSSTRMVSDQNKHLNIKSNTNSESSESKVNSVSELIKTPSKRPVVEKKDASTEQDLDLTAGLFAQNNHKSVQNSVQTNILSTNVSQPNGQIPVLADLNRQDLSKQPQKAIVKPQKSQILTHVIDGYIIKESANPFPVNGLSYGTDTRVINEEKINNNSVESLKSKNKNENSLNSSASSSKKPNSERHCLNCGAKRKSNSKNNRAVKRFCSQTCSEKFNSNNKSANNCRLVLYNSVTPNLDDVDLQRGQDSVIDSPTDTHKQNIEDKKKCKPKKSAENTIEMNGTKSGDSALSSETNHQKVAIGTPTVSNVAGNNFVPSTTIISEESSTSAIANLYIPPGGKNPLQWSVNDVYEFVRNLQGCTEFADDFRSQEIDGQALMLIKEDHLMCTMNMKLGPALKICSKINALREDVQKQS